MSYFAYRFYFYIPNFLINNIQGCMATWTNCHILILIHGVRNHSCWHECFIGELWLWPCNCHLLILMHGVRSHSCWHECFIGELWLWPCNDRLSVVLLDCLLQLSLCSISCSVQLSSTLGGVCHLWETWRFLIVPHMIAVGCVNDIINVIKNGIHGWAVHIGRTRRAIRCISQKNITHNSYFFMNTTKCW